MAIKIGITGGIGSGKSVVSQLLELMGVPVYISDTESKQLANTDLVIRQQLRALLGDEVYANGELNKPFLAAYLFAHPDHAAQVNAIIHPRVKLHFQEWVKNHNQYPIVGMESAILIEAGFTHGVDAIVMVYAPLELRIQRSMKRDNASRELIEQRIQRQLSDEEKRSMADFVIINDDETSIIPQVLNLISFLSENNHYLCRAK